MWHYQLPGDGVAGAQPGGPLPVLWGEVQPKDHPHASLPDPGQAGVPSQHWIHIQVITNLRPTTQQMAYKASYWSKMSLN